jgi:uncharacterized membrane protein
MNELIVVTILVAVQGKLKLPKISSREELATALGRLGAIPTDNVRIPPVPLWSRIWA